MPGLTFVDLHICQVLPPVHRDHPLVPTLPTADVDHKLLLTDQRDQFAQPFRRVTRIWEQVRRHDHLLSPGLEPLERVRVGDPATDVQPIWTGRDENQQCVTR